MKNLTAASLKKLERDDKLELLALLEEKERRVRRRKLFTYFPDTGPLRRDLYKRHMRFFELGARHKPGPGCPPDCDGRPHRERLLMAANRVGKTESAGGYELTLHLTGRYPPWWRGARFMHPISAWAAGDSRETVREILQEKLLGSEDYNDTDLVGTGLIPGDDIVHLAPMAGVPGAVSRIVVKNQFGGNSVLGFKSYDQGRKKFQGTSKHVILLDEEPPADVYSECVTRTMTVNGHMLCTFTPLQGLTEMVLQFVPGGKVKR